MLQETRQFLSTLMLAWLINMLTSLLGASNSKCTYLAMLLLIPAIFALYWYGLNCQGTEEEVQNTIQLAVEKYKVAASPADVFAFRRKFFAEQGRYLRLYACIMWLCIIPSAIAFTMAVTDLPSHSIANPNSSMVPPGALSPTESENNEPESNVGQAPDDLLSTRRTRSEDLNRAARR